MTSSQSQIDRRRFLRGVGGAVLALPVLELTSAEAVPMRMVASGVFYGLMPHYFHPGKVGRGYEIPRLLKPMARHRNDFTVFSGLDHNLGGGHTGTKFFLSGIPSTHARGYEEANVSIDQKAAMSVGGGTRYPSLVLGCETNAENRLSWTRNGNAVSPVTSAETLYNLLFKEPNAKERGGRHSKIDENRSVLDLVRDQAKSFQKDLGKADQEKLDQYFTSVRELESKIEQSKNWLDREKPGTDYQLPEGVDSLTLREKTPFFYDLMTLALQTDSTRVITLSFLGLGKDNGGFDGVSHGYHSLSHHGQVQSVMDELAIIEMFHLAEFARFLDRLKEVQEPNAKTLFDNTMALFGSGMSSGNSHSNRDLPVLLAGGGFKHGEHRHYAREGATSVPLNNLFVTMLQRFGLEVDQFNTSSGNLSELKVG